MEGWSQLEAHEQVMSLIERLQGESDNNRFLQESLHELAERHEHEEQRLVTQTAECQRQVLDLQHLLMRREEELREMRRIYNTSSTLEALDEREEELREMQAESDEERGWCHAAGQDSDLAHHVHTEHPPHHRGEEGFIHSASSLNLSVCRHGESGRVNVAVQQAHPWSERMHLPKSNFANGNSYVANGWPPRQLEGEVVEEKRGGSASSCSSRTTTTPPVFLSAFHSASPVGSERHTDMLQLASAEKRSDSIRRELLHAISSAESIISHITLN